LISHHPFQIAIF